uniref:Copper transport protein n=1 Tax=Elodea nuttallii TaxID=55313 RepID=A0A0X9K9N2_9LILI|nr:Cu transporter [Elodea nuttallii]
MEGHNMSTGGGGHEMSMGAPPMTMNHKMGWTHMTFFWGSHSEILFKGWPGTRGGMYALALVVVFLPGVLVEWVSTWNLTGRGRSRLLNGLSQTAVHALRMGLAYLLMLAVMSFNVGVLLVALAGHALGFLLFASAFCNKREAERCQAGTAEPPPFKC